MNVDISVIIPIYNTEEYLPECLESLLRQGNVCLEVIMVDDGSTDGSSNLAREYAEKYENYYYHRIENSGPARAREYGIKLAVGKYLTFMDSDDVLVDGTYEKMFALAEKNKSELTICNVARLKDGKISESRMHKRAFRVFEENTHICKNPNLIFATSSCDKLILRSFYLEKGFTFLEDSNYEDMIFALKVMIQANNTSVLNSVGYLWRIRDGIVKSRSQNTMDMQNLKDRIFVLRLVDDYFCNNIQNEDLNKWRQLKALEHDLMVFLNVCPSVPRDQAFNILHIIREYVSSAVDPAVFAELSVLNQQKYVYVMDENLDSLMAVYQYQKTHYTNAPITEKDGELFISLPEDIFSVKERNVTGELLRYGFNCHMDDVKISQSRIEISAHLYKRRININDCAQQKVSAVLYNEVTGAGISLKVIPEMRPELTNAEGMVFSADSEMVTNYNYDGTGFRIILDLDQIEIDRRNIGWNKILLTYENRFLSGKMFLKGCAGLTRSRLREAVLTGRDTLMRIGLSPLDVLDIYVDREHAFLDEISAKDGELSLVLNNPVKSVWAVQKDSGERIAFNSCGHRGFAVQTDRFMRNVGYTLCVAGNETELEKPLYGKKGISYVIGRECLVVKNTLKTGIVRLNVLDRLVVLLSAKRHGKTVDFRVRGIDVHNELAQVISAKLCVDDHMLDTQVELSSAECQWKDETLNTFFSVDFSADETIKNFYGGFRDVYVEYEFADGTKRQEIIYSFKNPDIRIEKDSLQIRCYRSMGGTVCIQIEQVWGDDENSPQKRNRIVHQDYPEYRNEQIHARQIVFQPSGGAGCEGDLKKIYELVREKYPEYNCIWILKDARFPIEGDAKRIRKGSKKNYYYWATSKYFVFDGDIPKEFVRRKGQILLRSKEDVRAYVRPDLLRRWKLKMKNKRKQNI